jgi:hypothetical protein
MPGGTADLKLIQARAVIAAPISSANAASHSGWRHSVDAGLS